MACSCWCPDPDAALSSPLLASARSQPAFDKSKLHYMSRGEKYRKGLIKEKVLARISRQEGWDKTDNAMAEELLGKLILGGTRSRPGREWR